MQLTVDSNESKENLRLAASFLLHLAGDMPNELADTAAVGEIPGVPAAPPVSQTETHDAEFPAAPRAPVPPPPPPPPPSNVVNFPTPPAPAPMAASASTAASAPAPIPTPASAASGFEGQVDSAGLPWDARIHQKKGGIKKDGTWKLLKGIDMTVVSAVVAELTKGKLPASVTAAPPAPPAQTDAFPAAVGAVPPPPVSSTVPLPPAATGSDTVPVPPPPATPSMPEHVSGSAAPVPVPPAPPVGSVPATGFRELIKKISAATTAGKVDASKIQSIVQARGCPSLQQLRDMPLIIPEVEADIDALLLG